MSEARSEPPAPLPTRVLGIAAYLLPLSPLPILLAQYPMAIFDLPGLLVALGDPV
jgi:hypothetical protein